MSDTAEPAPEPVFDLAAHKALRVLDIKAEANRRILAILPIWRQINLSARQAELQAIRSGQMVDDNGNDLPARALTGQERAELAKVRKAWDQVKAIRAASDAAEARCLAATTEAEADAALMSW